MLCFRLSPRFHVTRSALGTGLLILLLSLPVGCASKESAPSARLVGYSNSAYGFSIEHPSGWVQLNNPKSVLASSRHVSFAVAWKETTSDRASGLVGVFVLYHGVRLSVVQRRSYVRYVLKGETTLIGSQFPGLAGTVIDKVSLTRVADEPAVLVRGTSRRGSGRTSEAELWLVITRRGVYEVIVEATTPAWVSARASLVGTFQLH